MATIGKTKRYTKDGLVYYRLTVRRRGFKDICFTQKDLAKYKRANTPEQAEHNRQMDRILEARITEYKIRYNSDSYTEKIDNSRNSFVKHMEWVRDTRGANSKKTWDSWNSCIRHFIRFLESTGRSFDIECSQINYELCLEYKAYLQGATYLNSPNRPLKDSTKQGLQIDFHIAINDALARDYMVTAPHHKISLIDGKDEEDIKYLTKEEVKLLQDTECDTPVIKNAFLFACFTGLRKGDIEQLTWEKLIPVGDEIELRVSTEKKRKTIGFIIPKQAHQYLPERRKNEEKVFDRFAWTGYNNQKLKTFAIEAGIDNNKITSHTARHTFCVFQLKQGATLFQVAQMLGHSTTRNTERYYASFAKNDLNKIIAKSYAEW